MVAPKFPTYVNNIVESIKSIELSPSEALHIIGQILIRVKRREVSQYDRDVETLKNVIATTIKETIKSEKTK